MSRMLPIVEVEWLDSSSMQGWTDMQSALKHCPASCRTAGYLIRKTKYDVLISLNQSDGGGVGDVMCIPRFAVRSITVLKKSGKMKSE